MEDLTQLKAETFDLIMQRDWVIDNAKKAEASLTSKINDNLKKMKELQQTSTSEEAVGEG